ncbi:hypothetical protein V2J09_002954, partial [Rumex salicifolius]
SSVIISFHTHLRVPSPFPGSGCHRRLRLSSKFRRLRLGLTVIVSPLLSSGRHRRTSWSDDGDGEESDEGRRQSLSEVGRALRTRTTGLGMVENDGKTNTKRVRFEKKLGYF